MKKIIVLSMVICQIVMSCSSEDSTNNLDGLSSDIDAILSQPYSKLSPTEQKVKLEAEANSMLTQMEKSKTSGAIEAIQNLGDLLSISSVDIFNGENDNQIEEILNVSGVYGIYTWNNANQIWVKTASTTELKFVFPAKKNLTTNNASLSSKSTSSNIKVKIEDTYGNWIYDFNTGEYIQTPTVNDEIYLPTSVDAILTIDNKQAATFAATAKYTGVIETPDQASFKMVLNDGYTFEITGGKKAIANTAKSSFSYNGKNLISFNAGSTADIDALIEDEDLIQYQGKANVLVEIMDDFLIVADMDIAGLASDEADFEGSNPYPNYPDYTYDNPNTDYKKYYTDLNAYYKKESQSNVANFNKNTRLILVSKKDGTKIADIVERSEKDYSYNTNLPLWITTSDPYYTNGGYWSWGDGEAFTVQYYDEVFYLKFGDATEVEMSAYFSTGFENLETKFEDFLKAFDR